MAQYPFNPNDITTIRKYVSGLAMRFEDANIETGFKRAAARMKDIISPAVWQVAIDHFESDDFEVDEQSDPAFLRLDELVNLIRSPFANYAFFYHYIWLQMQISNDTITVADKENQPYRYQHLEAKDNLLETASVGVGELIDHLNENEDNYPEWTASEPYNQVKELIFKNHKDFEYYSGTVNAAAYYMNVSGIIRDIIDEYIASRFDDYKTIEDQNILRKVKKFVAYQTVAESCIRMDYDGLPNPLRKDFYNEITSRAKDRYDDFAKSRLSVLYEGRAENILREIDFNLSQKDKTPEDKPYTKFESDIDETDKFQTLL